MRQQPSQRVSSKETCSFYKRDLFHRFSAHPASGFLKHIVRDWPNPDCSFYLAVSICRDDTVEAWLKHSSFLLLPYSGWVFGNWKLSYRSLFSPSPPPLLSFLSFSAKRDLWRQLSKATFDFQIHNPSWIGCTRIKTRVNPNSSVK